MPGATNARRHCNTPTHPGHKQVSRHPRKGVRVKIPYCIFTLTPFFALLSACSEPVSQDSSATPALPAPSAPTSTLDGIFTADQASRGEGLFNTHCVRCHSIREFTGEAYATTWQDGPLSALYVRIANTMPLDQPGSLGTTEATAITAHILAENGMPSGSESLGGDVARMNSIMLSNSQ